jgi:hypothetical protein
MIYLHIIFQMHNSKIRSLWLSNWKLKKLFARPPCCFAFYKIYIFSNYILPNNLQGSFLGGASVTSTSQVCEFTMQEITRCGAHGRGEKCIQHFGWEAWRRPLGRPRRRWEDNIRMDLGAVGFGDVDWIHLAQDMDRWQALVNTVMNLRVP